MNISFVRLLCASFFLISILTGCKGGSDGAFTSVTPNENTLTSIKIIAQHPKQSETSTYIGGQLSFAAEGFYSNGSKVNLTDKVQWSSNSEATATIDNQGILVGIYTGVVNITASYNGVKSNDVSVKITDAILQSLKVTPEVISVPKGVQVPLTVTAKLSNDSTVDVTKWVDWSYSSVPTNITNNIFSSKEVGNYQVIASLQGIDSNIAEITVTKAELVSIIVTQADAESTVYRYVPLQLTAEGKYTDGTTQKITHIVEWHNSEPLTVSVSETGQVSYVNNGSSSISASLNDVHSNAIKVQSTDIHVVITAINSLNSTQFAVLKGIDLVYYEGDTVKSLTLNKSDYTLTTVDNTFTITISSLPSALIDLGIVRIKQIRMYFSTPEDVNSRIATFDNVGDLKGEILLTQLLGKPTMRWEEGGFRYNVSSDGVIEKNTIDKVTDELRFVNGNIQGFVPFILEMSSSVNPKKSYTIALTIGKNTANLTDGHYLTARSKFIRINTRINGIRLEEREPLIIFEIVDELSNRIQCEPYDYKRLIATDNSVVYNASIPTFIFNGKTCKINN